MRSAIDTGDETLVADPRAVDLSPAPPARIAHPHPT
jgi:hypothetical protein